MHVAAAAQRILRGTQMSKDPVCGEEVTVQRHTPKKLYKGVVYHFCSDACRETFEEDPSDHVRTRSRLGAYP